MAAAISDHRREVRGMEPVGSRRRRITPIIEGRSVGSRRIAPPEPEGELIGSRRRRRRAAKVE
jgi:hypothetical protein